MTLFHGLDQYRIWISAADVVCFFCYNWTKHVEYSVVEIVLCDRVANSPKNFRLLHGEKFQSVLCSPPNVSNLNTTEWGSHTFSTLGNYPVPKQWAPDVWVDHACSRTVAIWCFIDDSKCHLIYLPVTPQAEESPLIWLSDPHHKTGFTPPPFTSSSVLYSTLITEWKIM